MRKNIVIFLMCVLPSLIFGQEMTVFSGGTIPKEDPENPLRYKRDIQIELPFFDDFSDDRTYPNPANWIDNQVYTGDNFQKNSISIGCATFDAMNSDGSISAPYLTTFGADTLTSVDINLNYPADNSIFLSFFYQPQGLGEMPDPTDTLLLQIYSPTLDQWNTIWKAILLNTSSVMEYFPKLGSTKTWSPAEKPINKYQLVMLNITGEDYLQEGFKFRFRNYISLSSGTNKSLVNNADFWNVDYILLDKNRSNADTIFKDVAFVSPITTVLKDYEALPWNHVKGNVIPYLKDKISLSFKNNSNTNKTINKLDVHFKDLNGNGGDILLEFGAWNPSGHQILTLNAPQNIFTCQSDAADETAFEISAKLETDIDSQEKAGNNAIQYNQNFGCYYAYDDGTAEKGYGLTGEDVRNAMVAYKFTMIKADTLQGLDIYFNRSNYDYSQQYFYLSVWDDNQGEPGSKLLNIGGYKPEYAGFTNKFHRYRFDEPVFIPQGDFYVGWTQTTTDFLNFGLDMSRNTSSKIFFNVVGEWQNSSTQGAIMMRPLVGSRKLVGVEDLAISKEKLSIYPNPATDLIHLKIPASNIEFLRYEIIDVTGKTMQKGQLNSETISIAELTNGMYFLRVMNPINGEIFQGKFIRRSY